MKPKNTRIHEYTTLPSTIPPDPEPAQIHGGVFASSDGTPVAADNYPMAPQRQWTAARILRYAALNGIGLNPKAYRQSLQPKLLSIGLGKRYGTSNREPIYFTEQEAHFIFTWLAYRKSLATSGFQSHLQHFSVEELRGIHGLYLTLMKLERNNRLHTAMRRAIDAATGIMETVQ